MVEEHILENGLTVLTNEIHHTPVISHWIWYRVGSRNELPGKTGISHWVEHMQFKGTPKYPLNVLDAEISKAGGMWNAMTHLDWTTYYETLPADKIAIAIDLEADRMINSIFDPKETELERTVVISEREGNENEPLFRLSESIRRATFLHHPYSHEVIGEMDDLRSISREDLYTHYRNYYSPSNAVIAVAGDFSTKELIEKIQETYAMIPAREIKQHPIIPEPQITGRSDVRVDGPGDTLFLEIAYRAPAADDNDFIPLMVLDSLLCGPSSLSMVGGGSVSNKTSRLYQKLVEKDIAMSISGGLQTTIDPYLYSILIIASPDQDTNQIIAAVDEEIANVLRNSINDEEIDRAKKQARALFAYGSESITNQAFWMGYSAMFSQPTWFENYLPNVTAVNREQIHAVAKKYLDPDHRVIGTYQPTGVNHDE
jgi:zinc protease